MAHNADYRVVKVVPRLVRHDVGVDRAEALVASTSEDWSERAAGARVLAESIDQETKPVLFRLLLDHDNTAIVKAAAEAVLARRDDLGINLFCVAYAEADDEVSDHLNDSLLAVPQPPDNLSLMRDPAQRGTPGAIQAPQWLRLDPGCSSPDGYRDQPFKWRTSSPITGHKSPDAGTWTQPTPCTSRCRTPQVDWLRAPIFSG